MRIFSPKAEKSNGCISICHFYIRFNISSYGDGFLFCPLGLNCYGDCPKCIELLLDVDAHSSLDPVLAAVAVSACVMCVCVGRTNGDSSQMVTHARRWCVVSPARHANTSFCNLKLYIMKYTFIEST